MKNSGAFPYLLIIGIILYFLTLIAFDSYKTHVELEKERKKDPIIVYYKVDSEGGVQILEKVPLGE